MLHQARHILKSVFGYDEFRPLQEDIITHVLQRKDTLAIMPTGGGKSLCYQIPALIFDGLTVVVSPLISLMKDQEQQLTELGVAAVVLNSSISDREYQHGVGRITRNDAKLLFAAPETLLMNKTRALLAARRVECFAIDEAHCISEWGHDFRPEYRQLAELRQQFPHAGCLALTATATPRVQNDIAASLHFSAESRRFVASFNRQNLRLDVVSKTDPVRQTLEFLALFPNQSGIIYCQTRQQVDELAKLLRQRGFSVAPYHAGLSDEERHENQERFIRDDIPLMVATIAFGMGINKPNIRFILHYDLPKNIESYYQQIGRAGRDGLPAHCLLLYGSADIWKIKYFINQKDEREQRIALAHLNALIGFAETAECRRVPLLKYFGEEPAASECGMCDNCLTEKQPLVDVTIPAQKFLSCVKRTGETFGAGHVIDVLRGSQAEKVFKFGHQQLSTYGIGLEYSKAQWFFLSRQFVQQELLTQDEFGSLKLTPKAWEVMRGKMPVCANLEMSPQRVTAARDASPEEYDRELFERLRQQRKTLADAHNVPPYAIFPDKTLLEMATYFPQTAQSLRMMYGVGEIKFAHYGQIFLTLLRDYCQPRQLAERPKAASTPLDDIPKSTKTLRHHLVGDAFNAGQSVQELMSEYRVKIATILQHLHKYLLEGRPLRQSDELLAYCALSPAQQQRVLTAFAELGTDYLKPVFEALNEEVSYDDLHILRLHFLMQSASR